MKSVFVLASLAACALAQRLHIAEPTTMQNVGTGQNFTANLHMDVRAPTSFPRVMLTPPAHRTR